jgi:RHS repeat-associated protein
MAYDRRGNMLSATDAHGRTIRNEYDSQGNVVRSTDGEGATTTLAYDAFGNLTSITDALGRTTLYSVDANGNRTDVTDPADNRTVYTYDDEGRTRTMIRRRTLASGQPENITTTFNYDAMHRISSWDRNGHTLAVSYDADGNVASTLNALGQTLTSEYDALGRMIRTVFSDGTQEVYTYDPLGRKVSFTDRANAITRYEYDAVGRLTGTIHADGSQTRSRYDSVGRLLSFTDELGHTTTYAYAGNRQTITDALGNVTVLEFNSDGPGIRRSRDGNVARITDPRGKTTQFVYDHSSNIEGTGRLIAVIYSDGTRTTNTYDLAGRKIAETDQLGRTTTFDYDELDQLASVTDAMGNVTTYTFDEAGNRISVRDANGNVTRFEYDSAGRIVKQILPLGREATFEYNAIGKLIRAIDYNGATTNLQYDAANRLQSKRFADGSVTSWTYTPTGQIETTTDSRGVTRYTYDVRDRLQTRTGPDGRTITHTYDVAGNRISLSTPSMIVGYQYDALNRLQSVIDPQGTMTLYEYGPAGELVSTTLPNGTRETRQYDDLGRLLAVEHMDAIGTVFSGFYYTLDATGRRLSVLDHGGNRTSYDYDALYRLTQESTFLSTNPTVPSRTVQYVYDPVGNRLRRDDSLGGQTNYNYDEQNRLLVAAGANRVTYAYDHNGNLTSWIADSGDRADFGWNAENHPVQAQTSLAGTVSSVSYEYDDAGLRVAQTVNGTETRFMFDTLQALPELIEQYAPTGTVSVSYVHGRGIISQSRGASTLYYHADGLGSIRALTDDAGGVRDQYHYDAFGQVLTHQGAAQNAYLFAGELFDQQLNQYYLRARSYDPTTGRFSSTDPFGGISASPATFHKYVYAENDPVNKIDPTGLFTTVEMTAITTSIGALAGLAVAALAGRYVAGIYHSSADNTDGGSFAGVPGGPGQLRQLIAALEVARTTARELHAEGYYSVEFFGDATGPSVNQVIRTWKAVWLEGLNDAIEFRRAPAQTCLDHPNRLGHVYPDGRTRIFVCPRTFTLPPVGDGSDNTIAAFVLHELSHESFVNTIDVLPYGRQPALDRAITSPADALVNADNYSWAAGI